MMADICLVNYCASIQSKYTANPMQRRKQNSLCLVACTTYYNFTCKPIFEMTAKWCEMNSGYTPCPWEQKGVLVALAGSNDLHIFQVQHAEIDFISILGHGVPWRSRPIKTIKTHQNPVTSPKWREWSNLELTLRKSGSTHGYYCITSKLSWPVAAQHPPVRASVTERKNSIGPWQRTRRHAAAVEPKKDPQVTRSKGRSQEVKKHPVALKRSSICYRQIMVPNTKRSHVYNYINTVYDGLSKCLFPVLLINRNSMRAASCLPLKNMTYLDDVKTW